MVRTCKECGSNFILSDSEIDFYNSKGLHLPKRCKNCREKNKRNGLHNSSQQRNMNGNQFNRNNNPNQLLVILLAVVVVLAGIIIASMKKYYSGVETVPQYVYVDTTVAEEKDETDIKESDAIKEEPQDAEIVDTKIDETSSKSIKAELSTTESENNQDETGDVIETEAETEIDSENDSEPQVSPTGRKYWFRNQKKLLEHYEKHGKEMGFESAEEYEAAASAVVNNPKALHKTEKEDGDDVYYLEATNEFVVVSTDGKIRTYYKPRGGKAYYDRQ